MGDFSCNKFVTFGVLYKNEHKKNKNGADVIVFHLSMSYVTRPEQKKWNEIDKFENIEACLYHLR